MSPQVFASLGFLALGYDTVLHSTTAEDTEIKGNKQNWKSKGESLLEALQRHRCTDAAAPL